MLSGDASSINGVPLSSCEPGTLHAIDDGDGSNDGAIVLLSSECFGYAVGLGLCV